MTVIDSLNLFYTRLFLHNQKAKFSLAFFRIVFGLLMLGSTLRFVLKGWISEFYIEPNFHFTFYGFEFIKPLAGNGMYFVFSILILSTILITLGFFYRFAIVIYFLLFTYVELLDKTYYLNHYYFVSLIGFLLIFLPMNQFASLDRKFNLVRSKPIYNWHLHVIMLQVGLV
jgi:Vitamin K-dependent gamma-carboxylase